MSTLTTSNLAARRTAITFLGTANYSSVTYAHGEQRCETALFPVALARFFRPDRMLVVMTEKAREKHWATLQRDLAEIPLNPVMIPDGRNEMELWQIFATVAEQIAPGDRLVFDITLGFRSLPLLALLIADYVRVIKQVQVEALVYGAFEARDAENIAPVFDLTPFARLLDWTTATDIFLKTGRAADLATLVRQSGPQVVESSAPLDKKVPPDARTLLRGRLKAVADALVRLSNALRVARVVEVMEAAAKLLRVLEGLTRQLGETGDPAAAMPFVLLLERVARQFTPLALSDPLATAHRAANLQVQVRLLQWYLDHDQAIQAITLARELMVSDELAMTTPAADLTGETARREAESALGGDAAASHNAASRAALSPERLARAVSWNQISDLRNDVAHIGMRSNPRSAATIIETAHKLVTGLIATGTEPVTGSFAGDDPT